MLTQKEAVMCLEAITSVVLTDKILNYGNDADHEVVEDEEDLSNWEMNEELARGNFLALYNILSAEDRKVFIEKLKSMGTGSGN